MCSHVAPPEGTCYIAKNMKAMIRRTFWRHWLRTKFNRALVSAPPHAGRGHYISLFSPGVSFLSPTRRLIAAGLVVFLFVLVAFSAIPSVSQDPLNEKCVEFIGTHNGSLQGCDLLVFICSGYLK